MKFPNRFLFPLVTLTAVGMLYVQSPATAGPEIRQGIASWYSESDPYINLHTANGEIFDDSKMTCASWDYPFGTLLRVTNVQNGKSITCRVNDRGPARRLRRVIDLTKAAFREIAPLGRGLVTVRVTPVA